MSFNLVKSHLNKNKYFNYLNRKLIIFLVFLLFGLSFLTTAFADWDGLPFAPGSIDNPPCLPSQINCDVRPSLTAELDPIFIASQAFTITGMDISNWNGKQSALGFTPVSNITTVNGHALSSDIFITASDLGLGNVTNESKATMLSSPTLTGTINVNGNINMTGSIIPSINDTYALGSPSKVWKDLYVGAGSIYVNGQKVLQTDPSNSVLVSADVSQNLILQTTGGGNVELNPASGGGQVLLKSNIVLTAGKTIRSSDLSSVIFSDGTTSGNIQTAGNIISSSNLNGGISIAPNGLGNTYVTNGNFGVGTTSGLSKVSINGGLHVGGDSDVGDNNILADGTITGSNLSGSNTGDNATNSQYSGLITSKQDALNGTGLVRVSSGTVSYDNTNYVSGTPWTGMDYVTGTPWTSQGYVTGTPWTSAGYITDGNSGWDNSYGFITGYAETDPTFTASSASGITGTNISNWNTAYGWGNHASAGYLTSANISGLIPYTGGTSNVDLGVHNLTVDTNSLFVDSVNHRVGVGTITPGYMLDVNGNLNVGGNISFGTNNQTMTANGNLTLIAGASATLDLRSGPSGIIVLRTNGANERMRVDSAGNVGIGTTSPINLLSLSGTAARTIWMERNTTAATAGQGLTLSSGGAIAGTADLAGGDLNLKSGISTGLGTSSIHFFTGTAGLTGATDNAPTEKMTILGNGNVGIGTTNPQNLFEVKRYSDNSLVAAIRSNGGGTRQALQLGAGGGIGWGIIGGGDYNDNIQRLDISANQIFLNGIVYASAFTMARAGEATSTATQQNSFPVVFQNSFWTGSSATAANGWEIKSIASTAVNLKSRLSFRSTQDANAERMVLTSDGNLGVGTINPTTPLEVSGLSARNSELMLITGTGAGGGNADMKKGLTINISKGAGDGSLLDLMNGSTSVLRVMQGGNVGIGTASPEGLLELSGANISFPNSTGSTQGLGLRQRLSTIAGSVVLDSGLNGATNAWIQSTNRSNLSINYPLALNPNGGNVGVGTSTPSEKLQITNGNASITGSYGPETLSENNFSTHVKWNTTGDINDTNGNATYSHNTGTGTLAQTAVNFATVGVGSSRYEFTYTVSSAIETLGVSAEITNSFASINTALDLSEGIHTVSFISASIPGDFIISILSNSVGDGFTLDDLSLKRTIGGSVIAVSGLITGGGASGVKVTPAGDIGINTISPRAKFEVSGSSYTLSSLTASKEFTINFSPNAVANQKVDLYISGTQFFWGNIDVELTGNYSNQNTSGLIKKSFGLGLNPGGAIYSNEARYTEVSGATSDNFAISNLSWDATNSRYKITIVHRVSTDNQITVRMTALSGYDTSNIGNFLTFTKGPVYTTDTTVYPKPEVSYNGKVGFGVSSPTAYLHLKAGTAALNTAPLKFTSGTLLSTAEVGALEFNNDAYYGTITTGVSRKQFAFTTDISTALNNYLSYTGGTSNVDLGLHNLTVDTNTLFVNSASHKVGIGTINPAYSLSIVSSATGNLPLFGVTNSSSSGSSVFGMFNDQGNNIVIQMSGSAYVDTPYYNQAYIGTNGSSVAGLNINTNGDISGGGTTPIYFRSGGYGVSPQLSILSSGNVGIGTTSPLTKFHLAGKNSSDVATIDTGLNFNYVTAPTSLTASIIASSGNIDIGDHRYIVTYVTPIGETDKGSYSNTITTSTGNQQISLTNIPISSDYRVTARKIYRTKIGGIYNIYLLATINDNTTTTYTDNISDAGLGSTDTLYYAANLTNKFITINNSPIFTANTQQTFLGIGAGLNANTQAKETTLIGVGAGSAITTGVTNTLIGNQVGRILTTGGNNVSVGAWSAYYLTGSYNTFLGSNAGGNATSSSQNVLIGSNALANDTTGSNNTAIGYNAGSYIANGSTGNTTGNYNVFLGQATKALADGDQNEIVIGYNTIGSGSNTVTLGNTNIIKTILQGNIGIGATNPSSKLSIRGAVGSNSLEIQRANDGMAMITVDDWGQLTAGHGFIINAGGGYSGYGILDVRSSSPTHVPVSILGVSGQTGNLLNVTSNGGSWGNLFNIQANGNVGIGAATPGATLDVLSSTATSGTLGQFVNSNPSGGNQTLLNIAFTGNGVGYSGTALNINTGKMIGGSALQINAGINSGQFQLASGNLVGVTYSGTYLGTAGSYNQSGNIYSISRTNIGNGGITGSTLTINGAVATISDNATISSGLLVSTADVLDLTQNYTGNTGTVLKVIQNGTGPSATFNGGKVGIGTTNPTHLLSMGTGGGFYDESTGAWIDGSDLNYKDNVLSLDKYGLNTLKSLRPVSYNFKHSGVAQIGFIAQEVKLLIPELVSGEEGSMGLNYGGFSPLIVKSIQELDLKLEGIAMPADIITNRTFAERFYDKLIAWFASPDNGLEKICVKKADGTSFCANGDQLEKAVNGLSGGSVVPSAKVETAPAVIPAAPLAPVVVAPIAPVITLPVPVEPVVIAPVIPAVVAPAIVDSVIPPIAPVVSEEKAVIVEPVTPSIPVAEENA